MLTSSQIAAIEYAESVFKKSVIGVEREVAKQMRSIIASAAPAEGREFAYPTVDHWLTEIVGDPEVSLTISEMTRMEIARQAFAAARAGVVAAPMTSEAVKWDEVSDRLSIPRHYLAGLKPALSVLRTMLIKEGFSKGAAIAREMLDDLAEIERIDRAAAKGESDEPK